MRRTDAQRERDRARLVDYVANNSIPVAVGGKVVRATRIQSWMAPGDIAALVREGRLRREVRAEWDRQGGYASNLFGGAGVVRRRRAYLFLPGAED